MPPRSAPPRTWRTDVLVAAAHPGKCAQVDALLRAWRRGVGLETRAAWREWYRDGRFRATVVKAGEPRPDSAAVLGTSLGQMGMAQTRDALRGWTAGLVPRVRRRIEASSLPAETRHALHRLNLRQAWGGPLADVPAERATQRLFRRIVGSVRRETRRPDLRRLWPKIDQRLATLRPAHRPGAFALWLRLSTLEKGRRIEIPLHVTPQLQRRLRDAGGFARVAKTIQILPPASGRGRPATERGRQKPSFRVAVFTDMEPAFAVGRAVYAQALAVGRAADAQTLAEDRGSRCGGDLALDLGLVTLFGTHEGDLLGRGWMRRLQRYDRQISSLAASRQRQGLRVRSPRYDRRVARLRGFIKTEVNRILAALVARRHPARLILEHLRQGFQQGAHGRLSRRTARLVGLIGQRVVRAKLADLAQRHGIRIEHREAAYSSQECSACGYIDPKNRRTQARFRCRFCGTTLHADVNAPRVLLRQRLPTGQPSTRASRRRLLQDRCTAFMERYPLGDEPGAAPGRPRDPRRCNPHFEAFLSRRGTAASVTSTGPPRSRHAALRHGGSTVKSG